MAADRVPARSGAQREPDHPLSPSPKSAREGAALPAQTSSADVESIADAIVIKDGEPFFLCPPNGQIPIPRGHGYGLYHHDTRFLSGYELNLNGASLGSLAAVAVSSDTAVLELTNATIDLDDGRSIAKEQLGVRWTRELDGDRPELHDRIAISTSGLVSLPQDVQIRGQDLRHHVADGHGRKDTAPRGDFLAESHELGLDRLSVRARDHGIHVQRGMQDGLQLIS